MGTPAGPLVGRWIPDLPALPTLRHLTRTARPLLLDPTGTLTPGPWARRSTWSPPRASTPPCCCAPTATSPGRAPPVTALTTRWPAGSASSDHTGHRLTESGEKIAAYAWQRRLLRTVFGGYSQCARERLSKHFAGVAGVLPKSNKFWVLDTPEKYRPGPAESSHLEQGRP
jgi:hypothetical protein